MMHRFSDDRSVRFGLLAACFSLLVASLLWVGVRGGHDRGNSGGGDKHLRIGIQLEPPNLDPTAGAAGAIDLVVYANIFEGLTRIGEDGSVQPALARGWDISADGLRYRFYLREGVTFHDGTPFDSDDVIYTLDRARGPQSANAQQLALRKIIAVTGIDRHTVELRLDQRFPNLLTLLGWGDAVIVAPQSAGDNAVRPIGTGPYAFVRWQRSSTIELARNPAYWGAWPALDRVSFRIIPDPAVAYAAMLAGDIDMFPGYPAPENFAQLQKNPRFQTTTGLTEGETILALNHRRPALADRRVRRALSHAINKSELVTGAMFGFGTPIGSHYPPSAPGYVPLADAYPFDLAKTRQLLDAAGYDPHTPLALTLKLPPPAYARRTGEVVAAQLRAAGIKVAVENIEWAQWIDQVFIRHDFDLTIVAHTEPNDLDIYARPGYYFGYENPAYNRLIAGLHGASDATARIRYLGGAQRLLSQDAVNVFLFQLPQLGVHRRSVSGLWKNSPLQAIDITGARIDD